MSRFTDAPVDFLLLNFSNYPERPIFPYAFVQIGAQFRQHGLRFKAIDFLGQPPAKWPELLRDALDRYAPRCVGFHLRQVDSCDFRDYLAAARNTSVDCAAFEPVQWTKRAIDLVRQHTPRTRTIVGGIGFSFQPIPLFNFLQPDFGMAGDVNSFAARFDDILSGRDLDQVPNLIFTDHSGKVTANPRAHFAGPDFTEYTPKVIAELRAFYDHHDDPARHAPQVAVEIGRGCPYQCYFCGEPVAKGRKVSWRSLDVVRAELEFLISQGVTRFWLVCSELNPKGDKHFLEVARMMGELLSLHPGIEWSSYILPFIEPEDLAYLYSTNYRLSNNEVLSLDPENLHAAKVPYTVEHAKRFMLMQAAQAPEGQKKKITLFTGNTRITAATVKRTARYISEYRLYDAYDHCSVVYGSRIYGNEKATGHGTGRNGYAFRDGDLHKAKADIADPCLPTFILPDTVTDELTDLEDVDRFYKFCGDYLFSRAYRHARGADGFADWCAERGLPAPTPAQMARIEKRPHAAAGAEDAQALDIAGSEPEQQQICREFATGLGLDLAEDGALPFDNLTLYETIFERYPGATDLTRILDKQPEFSASSQVFFNWLSYRHGLDLALRYKPLMSAA
ncbi:B12-binding domain-containing radical SAM protein [Thalassococcus sp. BH17M4-6]|uniref:B12-binding domain-containing radical SAM protein n=1 Tax=Thalassococcus sp. BH17M4-6 TaxID=3413148 RepID=UPI003BDD0BF2